MPRRPRSHQLETESRRAFQSALPSAWVCRDLTDDYGIDAEVELFDANGYATGEKFLVQLKATDESELAKALIVPLPTETARYYVSLRLPVLMVRYVAASSSLYVRWFHAFEERYDDPEQKSVVLHFDAGDAWTANTPGALAADVAAYRLLRAQVLRETVTFAVAMNDGTHGMRRFELLSKLREAADSVPRVAFEPMQPDRHYPNFLRVTANAIEVTAAGSRRFVISDYQANDPPFHLHRDCLIGVAGALAAWGHALEASEILARYASGSRLLVIMPCAAAIAATLARANHQATLIALADDTLERGLINQAMLFITTLFGMHLRLSVQERLLGAEAMVRFASKLHERGDIKIAAQMRYNAASLFRDIGAHRRAIHIYRQAAAIDPSYLVRSYFWQELAGMFFMNHRWQMSATFYRRALELEDSDETAFLLADALFFSGEFAEAHQIWTKRLQSVTEETAIWFLKLRAADIIIGTLRIERQGRQPREALAQFTDDIATDAQIELACARALQLDPLCNLAWFNLAGVRVRAGNVKVAAMAYVVAVVAADWDVQAWGNLIAAADQAGEEMLKMTAEIAGGVQRRHELVSDLAGRVPDDVAEGYAEAMSDFVGELPQSWKRATIRTHGRGGRWAELRSDDDDDDDRVEVVPGSYEIRPIRKPNAAGRFFTAIRNLFR